MEIDVDASLDVVTMGDLRDEIRKLRGDMRRRDPYYEKIMGGFSGIVANGIVGFRVYDVPDGKTFYLTKYIAWSDARNPSTGGVYSNAAAWCGIFHGQPSPVNLADFWPEPEAANGQVLPYMNGFGKDEAPEFRQNDNIYFQGVGLTNGENVTLLFFGLLMDLKLREGHEGKNGNSRPLQKHSRV